MLSNKAITLLANTLAPKVIERIYQSEEFITFLHEQIPTAIDAEAGEMDDALFYDLALAIMDKVRLSVYD
jgi:hypothetical protein